MRKKLFKLSSIEPGMLHCSPVQPMFIKAISYDGQIELKEIEDFSIHKMTPTYIVFQQAQHKQFQSFYVTEDHSLLVYDSKEKIIKPVTCLEIKELQKTYNRYYFIKHNKNINSINDCYNLDNCEFISLEDIRIIKDDVRDTYDFTIKDYKTFAINNGLFVQDTIAVYMPLTIESQKEAKEKMFRKTRSVATGQIMFELAQGMILGLYLLTKIGKPSKFISFKPKSFNSDYLFDLVKKDPDYAYIDVTYTGSKSNRPIRTTLGRILVNQMLPKQIPFFDKVFNKKNIKSLFNYLNKYLTNDEILTTYDKLKNLGFETSSRFAISMPIDEMIVPEDLKREVLKLKNMDPDTGNKYITNELTPKLIEYVKKNYPQIYAIFDSGSRGTWSDLVQMVLAKGYVEDAEGKVVKVPVAKGFIDNLNAVEAFVIAPSARRGIANRSLKTAESGYLTRRLVQSSSNIKIDFSLNDCRTDRFLKVNVKDEYWAKAIIDRWTKNDVLITEDNYKDFIGQTVELHSPIFCKSPKICKKCYGELWKLLTSNNIGIESGQIVGERGTQLIMKTFHTGGLAETSGMPQLVEKSKSLIQTGDKIITKQPCKVTIDKTEADVVVYEDRILLKQGLAQIYFKDDTYEEIDIQSPYYAVQFSNFLNFKAKGDELNLTYDSNQEMAEIELVSESFGVTLQQANALFERRVCKDCNIEKTLETIFDLYKTTGRRLVHFEVILSNMVRSKKNLYVPFRLSNDKEYTILGVSQVPFYTSPLLALAFQNIGKAIETGLMFNGDQRTPKSDFVNILLGE